MPSSRAPLLRAVLAALSLTALTACGAASIAASAVRAAAPEPAAATASLPLPLPCAVSSGAARLQPAGSPLLGVDLDWATDSAAGFVRRTGVRPAVLSAFVPVALEPADVDLVDRVVDAVVAQRAALMLTVEPVDGLAAVTPAVADRVAAQVRAWSGRGVPVYVRFGEQMNGSWYRWGQQPRAFVAAFRLVAAAVHRSAPLAAMVWAPNDPSGYPFRDGRQQSASSPLVAQLDTDHDGRLDRGDDPFTPYWPGTDAVDWVGMSVFHWGAAYPWDAQTAPVPGELLAVLRPFVDRWSVGESKPFALTETAARWSPGQRGPSPLTMKSAWLSQVLDPALRAQLPTLRMATWLEWRRHEPETRATVDWRVSADPAVAAAFARAATGWRSGGDLGLCLPRA